MIQRKPTLKFDLTFPSAQPKVYQRLGETQATDIVVQVLNDGKPFSLTGVRFGFELRNDKAKIIIDTNQAHFSVIDNAKGIFRYRVTDEGFGYIGNSYLAYFTLTISDVRITTERFRFHNDEDVQVGADGLQEHYVSVIDDLVASNAEAIAKAQEIKALIESNQVVKKSGDTMTGSLKMTVPAAGSVGYGFQDTAGAETSRIISIASGNVVWQDRKNLIDVFTYTPATKTFTMQAESNLLKKTGDTMTGLLTTTDNIRFKASGERSITWWDGNDAEYIKLFANNGGNRLGLYSTKNSKSVWEYNGDSDSFNVNTNTNLVKKTGDTLTGDLTIDRPNATTFRNLRFSTNNVVDVTIGQNTAGKFLAWDQVGASGIWEYDKATKTFNVTAPNTNIVTKISDGKATPVLTADALVIDANNPPVATRRGSSVTFRCYMQRKVGSSSNLMTTLPTGYRPTETIFVNAVGHDGTVCRVTIGTDGNVFIGNAGNASTEGKQLAEVITYVVN